jgi:hypothetical protein
MQSRSRVLALVLAIAAVVFAWGIFSTGQFRPTGVAAAIIAIAIAVGAVTWSRAAAIAAVVGAAIAVALLFTVPAGTACDLPIVEFVPHAVEDASGPHDHDRCQLESDRRSLAAFVIGAAVCVGTGLLFVRRRTAVRPE